MRKIKLADGSTYEVDRCGAADGVLWLNVISGASILSMVEIFSDTEKTATIEHYFEGTDTDHIFFVGYTTIISAALSPTGLTLALRRS